MPPDERQREMTGATISVQRAKRLRRSSDSKPVSIQRHANDLKGMKQIITATWKMRVALQRSRQLVLGYRKNE